MTGIKRFSRCRKVNYFRMYSKRSQYGSMITNNNLLIRSFI